MDRPAVQNLETHTREEDESWTLDAPATFQCVLFCSTNGYGLSHLDDRQFWIPNKRPASEKRFKTKPPLP